MHSCNNRYMQSVGGWEDQLVVSIRSGEMLRLRERNRAGEPPAEPLRRSGEMLRLRDRYGEPDPDRERLRLRETYRDPVGEGDLLPRLRLRPLPGLPEAERFRVPLGLRDPPLRSLLRLLLRLFWLPCSLLPSIASSKRLFLGPISSSSSRTSRFVSRGRMRSHTRSSFSSWSMNSSM